MQTNLSGKRHLLSLGAALLIVCVVGLLSYRDWRDYERNLARVEATRNSIDRTQEIVSWLKDAESAQRAYLLTGDEGFLTAYQTAGGKVSELLGPAPPAEGLPTEFDRLTTARLKELAGTLQLQREGNPAAALLSLRAAPRTDEIQTAAARIVANRKLEVVTLQAATERGERWTRFGVLLGTGLLVLIIVGTARHVDRLITDLEQARQFESQQRATLATTLSSIGDAVIATDQAGKITFVNPVAEALTGWSVADSAGQHLTEVFRIVNEVTRATVEGPVERVLREGAIVGLANHTVLLARDGKEVPIDDSGAPIRDASGGVTGVILVFRDVTARRQSQRALHQSEQRYRLLFESNPQPMWVYDVEALQFLAVNNAACRNYGYTAEEFLAMTLRDIRPQEDVPALLDATKVVPSAFHTEGPWRHRKKDGTIILVEIAEHPLEFDGREACLVMPKDITESTRLQEQFQQAQRLESVGRLAGGVAHDFNNLLTVINGYCDMLLTDLPENAPDRESLLEIRGAGERAASLTQQLLAFSRLQFVKPTVLNLNQSVSDIQKMLKRLIGEDIELVVHLSPDLGNVMADGGQVQQVIMNLAVNARDAMPKGGRLIIETANQTLDEGHLNQHPEVPPGLYVVLTVADTGTGMTKEVREKVFEPFFTTKPTGVGTGLGLATVYGIVKQSGGWIWVYSEPGAGSTFRIYLPRADASVATTGPNVKTDLQGSETVLIVEDQAELRNLAVKVLSRYGYQVLSAANGDEALFLCQDFAGTIHLLLTDVIMPGIGGPELADRLAALRPGIKVLFMSGYTDSALAHRGMLGEETALLQKPFTPEALAERVRQALGARATSGAILLVDDDPSVRRLLCEMLTSAGFQVVEAGDGRQALEHIAHYPFDLVITDLVMPEQEGLEIIRVIRKQHPGLKIIAISGAFKGEFLAMASRFGADAVLHKPIARDTLVETVRRLL